MRPIPHAVGIYLAILEFIFAIGWITYAIYLPKLAAAVGLPAGVVILILMLDQAIFTVTDLAMGIAADKVSRLVGRLGHWVAAVTIVSGAAFIGLPLVAGAKLGPAPLIALTVTWAVTSSALRAPPLMLLGKYAARPAIPYLASLAMLGLGVAGAVAPFLAIFLRQQDPRLPFIIASVALVLTSFALSAIERRLAREAPAQAAPAKTLDSAVPSATVVFTLTTVVLALGFQLHFFFNSARLFRHFTPDIGALMPVFWAAFSVAMFPASLLTRRWGGLPVMGLAGVLGAFAIVLMEHADSLALTVTAQAIVGATWGAILMSAFAAAAALGATGAEGKTTGLLFSALALATFARMATAASGALADPALTALLGWAPVVCWALGGAVLIVLSGAGFRRLRHG